MRALPATQLFRFYEPDAGVQMEFRLIYQGPLRAERDLESGPRGRSADKQKLRKHFHLQLRELWKQHPSLRDQSDFWFFPENIQEISYPKNTTAFTRVDPGTP